MKYNKNENTISSARENHLSLQIIFLDLYVHIQILIGSFYTCFINFFHLTTYHRHLYVNKNIVLHPHFNVCIILDNVDIT